VTIKDRGNPAIYTVAQRNTSELASLSPHYSLGILGIIFDSDLYLRVVKSEEVQDTSAGKGRRSTLGSERFLHLFFKNIISIFNAVHVFSDKIFFNDLC